MSIIPFNQIGTKVSFVMQPDQVAELLDKANEFALSANQNLAGYMLLVIFVMIVVGVIVGYFIMKTVNNFLKANAKDQERAWDSNIKLMDSQSLDRQFIRENSEAIRNLTSSLVPVIQNIDKSMQQFPMMVRQQSDSNLALSETVSHLSSRIEIIESSSGRVEGLQKEIVERLESIEKFVTTENCADKAVEKFLSALETAKQEIIEAQEPSNA